MKDAATRYKFETRDLTLLVFAVMALLLFAFNAAGQTPFVQQARLGASDAVLQDGYGFSVAISDDTAIVGGPRNGVGPLNHGAAYVYVRTGATWVQQQKLTPSDGAATDQFGYSVAINGNTAAVGRFNSTTGQNRSDGKVYIFTRTGTVWTETQTLVSNDIAQGDVFGSRLTFENDTLVVSAYLKGAAFQGAVYVFTRPAGGGNFAQQAKLLASDAAQFDYFGYSIAVSGDTAVIGAAGQAGFPNSRGKAYVFTRNGSTWSEQQILLANDGVTGDAFGFSVGVSGDTAIIGAPNDATSGTAQHGSAYLFVRSGGVWTQQQKVMHADIATNDFFGTSVAIKGETAVAGASGYEPNGGTNSQGAVFVFARSGTAWTQTQRLSQTLVRPDALGGSIAYDGTSVITGAFANSNEIGATYIFAPDVYTQQSLSANNSSNFGHSVAVEGDTLVVGASTERREHPTTGLWNDGAVYIYIRNGSGWIQQARLVASDLANGRQFGESVAISGNTVVVGAFTDDIGSNGAQGAAYVFTRAGSTWTFQQKLTADDGAGSDNFGNQVSISNDTIAVGARQDDVGGNSNQGSTYVYTRSGGVWTQSTKITANDGAANSIFGTGVSLSAGTLVVGANGHAVGKGATYVYTGSGSNWVLQQKLTADDGLAEDEFGRSVSISGDSVIIGAPSDDVGGINQHGSAYVFTRSGTTWTQQTKLTAPDGAITDLFGFSVAISGDRAVVGTNFDDITPDINNGSAHVFVREGTAWSQQSKLIAADRDSGDEFGFSVAIDGGRIVVGADEKDVAATLSLGAVYVFTDTSLPIVNSQALFDYDGDGKADISIFRPSSGDWYVQQSLSGPLGRRFGVSTDKITPADFDGDGKTDIAVYRPAEGVWFIVNSSNGVVDYRIFGLAEDLPAPADYDGDGKADICVFRPSTGTWWRQNSSNGSFSGIQFGSNGDLPTVGDFDGDGKADIGIWRPSNSDWYHIRSSNGTIFGERFGISTDRMVPADYDGDGKTDIAIWRPSTGIWYIKQSSNDLYVSFIFGLPADIPAPGDFDGDGKTDRSVFRPSDGTWYITNSTNGSFTILPWGQSGDRPTPGAFLN